ncbi:helix-turn-helix domain-containing protein [Streptomyces sp. NPDC002692]
MLRLNTPLLFRRAGRLGDETIGDISARSGISRSTLHRLEAGETEPSIGSLWALHRVYGGSIEALIKDDSQQPQTPAKVPAQRRGSSRRRRTRTSV